MSMNQLCRKCNQKDDLIDKYLKLIKLLKTKCEKTAKYNQKNNTIQSDTLYQSSCDKSKQKQHQQPAKSTLNPEKNTLTQTNINSQLSLAAIVINNKSKKALLNHSLNRIKQSLKQNTQHLPSIPLPNLQGNLSSIIQSTLSSGKNMQHKISKCHQIKFQKQLLSKTFHLQLLNQSYLSKIHSLHKQIEESQKRFFKETQKKRQSLQTFAQQMRQKTQQVIQLQQLIKKYQKALGKSVKNMAVETVLVEDVQEIKKTCFRLENINEKLNDDVRKMNLTFQQLNTQIKLLNQQNQSLRNDIKLQKEKNFQLSKGLEDYAKVETSHRTILKRLEKKITAVKRKQKQLCQSMRLGTEVCNESKIVSTKNTDLTEEQIHIEKRQYLKQVQIDQKLEQVFTFLFNIKTQDYHIKNVHLFDEDEIDLLKSHKQIYLKNLREDSFIEVQRENMKTKKQIDESRNFDRQDQIFYKKSSNQEENSFFYALDPTRADTLQPSNSPISNMKLIEMEIEKNKLIQKISQLKNHQMHIRNVILNLLKVLDLSANLKPQSEGIMEIIFDFFQYSEDEKASIFKEKKKKFWGII